MMIIRLTNFLIALAMIFLFASLPNNSAQAASSTSVPLLQATEVGNPAGIAQLPNGTILFTSTDTHKIYSYVNGEVEIFAGLNILDDDGNPMSGLHDGEKDLALFDSPAGLAVDSAGNIYVADTGNHAIRKITPDGAVSTIAGDGIMGNQDGSGTTARFDSPTAVAIAKDGTIYVADTLNHVIRAINKSGEVTTLTKNPNRLVEVTNSLVVNAGDFANGSLNEAMFNEPAGLVLDEKGNLFVADSGNNLIRYIDFASGEVSTVTGKVDRSKYNDTTLYGEGGFLDGKFDEAQFSVPKGLVITSGGNLLVTDAGNNHLRYIHLANQSVQTLTGDGDLLHPSNAVILTDGDIVVTDTRNNQLKKFIMWEKPDGFGDYEDAIKRYDDENIISPTARDAVYKVQRLGIMTGSEGDQYLFSPTKQLTRAQFAKVIVNHLGLKLIPDSGVFPDVADDAWYTPYIHTAATHGIINGYKDGTFQPNAPIKREQIALMIGRAYGWKKADVSEILYKDQEKISEEALPYIHALYERKIMRGQLDGSFKPESPVLRETAAVIMANF